MKQWALHHNILHFRVKTQGAELYIRAGIHLHSFCSSVHFKNEKPRLVNLREWDFVRIAETHRIEGKPELCLEISQCQGASACLDGVCGVSREGPSEKSQPGRKQEWGSKAEGRRGLCRAWCSSARGLMQERPHVPRHPATRARCHWPR